METSTLVSLIYQIVERRWNPRIEFALHGEPSMHPDFVGMIGIVRKKFPKAHIMMTSNGGGFLRKPGPLANVQDVFNAGLNVLALDDYQNAKLVPKIREAVKDGLSPDIKVFEYPSQPDGNPHGRRPGKMLSFIEDLTSATKGTHSHVNTHCGAGSPPNDHGHGKRCAKPFRELSVRWDGSVAGCCNMWRGHYRCGNVIEDGLEEVWNSKAFGALRVAMYHGRRDMVKECSGCDAKSHRVGLLPDKLGKETLPAPDQSVRRDIAEAQKRGPLTEPVLRPGET
jgi:radical SAM protein with 4Fe4S-binding SPASM domain